MSALLLLPLVAFAALYALWVFFLAVMALKRARDGGLLVTRTKVLGYPILFAGLILDAIANIFVMTIILMEIPKEMTVTARLKRHNRGAGWRQAVAAWFKPLLDPYDPSGIHI